jgi:hypothetical protein
MSVHHRPKYAICGGFASHWHNALNVKDYLSSVMSDAIMSGECGSPGLQVIEAATQDFIAGTCASASGRAGPRGLEVIIVPLVSPWHVSGNATGDFCDPTRTVDGANVAEGQWPQGYIRRRSAATGGTKVAQVTGVVIGPDAPADIDLVIGIALARQGMGVAQAIDAATTGKGERAGGGGGAA